MKKRIFTSLILSLLMLCTLVFAACGDKGELKETSDGKTLRIYVWNTEFQERFNKYFVGFEHMPEGVEVEFVLKENQDNVYQNALDDALNNQSKAKAEDRIDMFLIEADYALKYTGSEYSLDVIKDIGLTADDISEQYQYTKDVVTYDGAIKALSWQATPMGFMYRRSMAKAILGTDVPSEVQAKLNTWANFDAVAAKMKAEGNFMLSGYDDSFRVFSNNTTESWVNEDGTINIDQEILNWLDQTERYTNAGYNNKASLWSPESQAQMAKDGKVFGYFGPSWFMDFSFMEFTLDDKEAPKAIGNGGYGDWGMVEGPQSGFWGGTWLCGAAGTDNLDLVKKVMKIMTCNEETLVAITKDYGDFTNNEAAMERIANDKTYGYPFLGGQNHIAVLLNSAKNIKMGKLSIYDQTMTEQIQTAFKDYFDAKVDKDKAWSNFYKAVKEKHNELVIPS